MERNIPRRNDGNIIAISKKMKFTIWLLGGWGRERERESIFCAELTQNETTFEPKGH